MLFRHGRITDAIPYFEKAASVVDTDWSNPMMLITCYDSIGDKSRGRKATRTTLDRVEQAIAKDPTNGTALAVGAYALAMFGEEDRARDWVRRALLLDPDNLNMRYNLACTIIRQLGDIDETLKTLEPFFERINSTTLMRHMEVDPDFDPIRNEPRFKEMLASAKQRLGMTEAAE
jgi:adenylate cyclase